MTDLDRFEDIERAAALRAGLAGLDRAKACPFINFDVAIDRHSAKVVVVLIRAGGHVSSALQSVVGDHAKNLRMRSRRHSYRAQRTGGSSEGFANLLGLRGSDINRPARVHKLCLVQLVIPAHQDQGNLIVEDVDQGFDLPVGASTARKGRKIFDGSNSRRGKFLGSGRSPFVIYRSKFRRSLLDIRRIVTFLTHDDVVFAGVSSNHELGRLASAHCARTCFYRCVLQSASTKNSTIGFVLILKRLVQTCPVNIERVSVLHCELAYSKQA